MLKLSKFSLIAAAIFTLAVAAFGQNKYEGYSLSVDADAGGACPMRYLAATGARNAIEVYVAGTNGATKATALTTCNGSILRGAGSIAANGEGRWCFQGPEPMYEIRLTSGVSNLWYPIDKNSGEYNVKDFRPVTRSGDGKYSFTEPADYTSTIRNAINFIATRQGGTLRFPDGDYIVGTTDGERRDPNYQAITLTSGINIVGAGSNTSAAGSNLPNRFSPTRIRLRNTNQTIFRIGGCTNQVTVKDLELMGNSALYGETPRDASGNYGIEGLGKWEIDPRTGAQSANSSQVFNFENVTFQNLDRGIFVHNANDGNCKAADQVCGGWQFDYVTVDHCVFMNNKTGIWVDTHNTDWSISSSLFSYIAANAPGDGIHIQKAGSMSIRQSFGGGYDYGAAVGGTFIYVDAIQTLTIVSSGSERGKRSLYFNPLGAIRSQMVTMIGSIFGDPIELHGNMNFTSSGNSFGPKTIQADPNVQITSVGDRFCSDPAILPGLCKDASGLTLTRPNFDGGRMMFQTGRLPEGTGPNRIDGKPNQFGYTVELRDGLMQYDPNITFGDITKWASGGDGRPPVQDGALVYCRDCRRGGTCSQGQAGQDGSFAKRINGKWMCD
ncbi:MAG: hypothetical protein ABJA02_04010 [Acidobacteriota bacterium]